MRAVTSQKYPMMAASANNKENASVRQNIVIP
jgi:hypothetical protein